MSTVSIEIPETLSVALGGEREELGKSILDAAVVKWYELGLLSQGTAAEILGTSRSEFLDLLARYRVSAWQYTSDELDEELGLG